MRSNVVIPTHERPNALGKTLAALAASSVTDLALDVIVVVDGSTSGYEGIQSTRHPFSVRWLHQDRSGATTARNHGAAAATADVLIFMDDDITASPDTLARLARRVLKTPRTVALGTLTTMASGPLTPLASRLIAAESCAIDLERQNAQNDEVAIPATHCLTGLLAIRREDFEALGCFMDPTGGWPNWDDIDFGLRAQREGFSLVRLTNAIAIHHDRYFGDLGATSDRYRRAGRSAVRLFGLYPDLAAELPMFYDTMPIDWRRDAPVRIVRKALRRLSATPPARIGLVGLAKWLERTAPGSLLDATYRWAVGAAICAGFHEGLRSTASTTQS